ncbi:MAG: DegQ family serine endoprotease [Proteobacteria bacterium]|nr:DegQ family serine endoprotease [Pseudomonadota bacterium]
MDHTMKLLRTFFAFALTVAFCAGQAFAADPTPPPLTAPANPDIPHEGFSKLAEKLLPAVVNVSTTQTTKDKVISGEMPDIPNMPNMPPGFDEFFKDFMDKQRGQGQGQGESDKDATPRERKTTSLGSGFLIDPSGYVVTNNHVIQDADEINVILHDDTNLKAKVIGRDPKTDIALLKVEHSKPLPYVKFGDSDTMKVGDWIVVIGNPFGLGGTVTQGIISARQRDINSGPYDDYIQTDASINRGNSGGPMFNLQGEVIGISTAIFSPSGGSVGIGFAIPSSMAQNVVEQLKKTGKIRRGWLGVRIQNVTEEIAKSLNLPKAAGALVSSLSSDSPAAKGGVQAGDVIITFDGKEVQDMRHLPRIVAETSIDRTVPVVVWRDNKDVRLNVKIGEMKEAETADTGDDEDKEKKQNSTPVSRSTYIGELDLKVSEVTAQLKQTYQLHEDAKGVVIISVGNDSPLGDKGARPGDLIVEAAQKDLKEPKDLEKMAKDAASSKKPLLMLIDRQGDLRFIAVNTVEPKAEKKKNEKKEEKKKDEEKKAK